MLCNLAPHPLDEAATKLGRDTSRGVVVFRYANDLLLLARKSSLATSAVAALRRCASTLTAVTCYGDVSVSGPALDLLFRHAILTAWLTPAGTRCRGRLARTDAPSMMTRVRQHRAFALPHARLEWAKAVVVGKISRGWG